jgi:ribose-phosphate pyrophosphokinase
MSITLETETGQDLPFKTLGFPGGERHVDLGVWDTQPKHVVIRARIDSSDDLMTLFLLSDALQRIHMPMFLELPYMPYARQDRVCSPGQAHSLDVVGNFINTFVYQKVAIWDPHSWLTLAAVERSHEVPPSAIIEKSPQLSHFMRNQDTILVAPDKGAVQRVREVSTYFGQPNVLECSKNRDPATGALTGLHIPDMDLDGKTLVIVDDICDGGWTFTNLATRLREQNPWMIILYTTHGIFSRGLAALDGFVDYVYASDSKPIPIDSDKFPGYLTTIPYKHQF